MTLDNTQTRLRILAQSSDFFLVFKVGAARKGASSETDMFVVVIVVDVVVGCGNGMTCRIFLKWYFFQSYNLCHIPYFWNQHDL